MYNIQSNTEETHNKNSRLIEVENIPNTPFKLVKQNEQYFITLGNYALTIPTKNKETTLLKLQNEMWDIIGIFILLMIDKHKNDPIVKELYSQVPKTISHNDRGSEADLE